jgi:L-ascorbate metabolism protein UlaG (beta-lactamase superfamily)
MRISKYPQSCVVIEGSAGGRALVDPGDVAMDVYRFDDFGSIDAVLFTHRHADHFDPRAVDAIMERGLPIFANADVCGLITDGATTTITDGQKFQAAGFDVVAHDMPHVTMVNGAAGPPNTGFVFDGRLLHPGDSMQVDGIRVDALAVPIAGPSVSFRDAYVAVETTGSATAVPIHYDKFLADPQLFEHFCDIASVVVLGHGESADL